MHANHPLQTTEWGIFSQKLGFEVVHHQQPFFQLVINRDKTTGIGFGYIPKGCRPDEAYIEAVRKIAHQHHCMTVTIEPDLMWENNSALGHQTEQALLAMGCRKTKNRLYSKTFIIDLNKSEVELEKSLHPKTRYNCRVAKRHMVRVCETDEEQDFYKFVELFLMEIKPRIEYGNCFTSDYFMNFWNAFKGSSILRMLKATIGNKTLAVMILLQGKDTVYYPFGASLNQQRHSMASTYLMWEAIRFAKVNGGGRFDFWGAMGEVAPTKSYHGVHNFFQRFGGELKSAFPAWSVVCD